MKRRTFLQTIIGAITAVFLPKPKQDPMAELRRSTANTKFKPPLKKGEQNPDGQLCLIDECDIPHLRLVRYKGNVPCHAGMIVCYDDKEHLSVVPGEFCKPFDAVIKTPPDEFAMKYPTYKRYRMCYVDKLDA